MHNEIQTVLQTILSSLGVSDGTPEVFWCDEAKHGEYSTNIAMQLAKQLKKAPMDIAIQIVSSFDAQMEKDSGLFGALDHIETVKPGFINFYISETTLQKHLDHILDEGERFSQASPGEKKKIMVEYTDPNPMKEMHIGHLYSNAVGESIARIFEAMGHEVKRADYYGDVGMHVAKTLWGLHEKLTRDHQTMETLSTVSLGERIKYLGQAYSLGTSVYEGEDKDEKAIEQMKDINYYAYIAAQERNKKESGKEPVIDYTAFVGKKKAEEATYYGSLYQFGYAWSMEYFKGIFRRLGTTFDYFYPESMVAERGMELVSSHIGDVFEKSDGAIVYRGEKDGLHTRVFVNALGLPTYEAKELGLAPTKFDDFPYDHSYIVTGNEINEYFRVLMSALGRINPVLAAKNTHVGHGMVRNADGSKMSSRAGTALTAEGLLDAVKDEVYAILKKSSSTYTKGEEDAIAEAATIAAIKYSFLRVSLPSDIAFDIKSSVSFDGDSGPYLLYTYARCQSVLRKAGVPVTKNDRVYQMNPEERAIARLISHFSDVLAEASDHLAPSILCSYVNDLAQAFNYFYAKHTIVEKEVRQPAEKKDQGTMEFRLKLTSAVAHVLSHALHLLGIATVERM